MKPSIRFSFRVYKGDKPYLGPGRIELMELIIKHGSIAKAAAEMDMSYRKAWQMVKELNEVTTKPMIEVKLGGKKGGGASVSQEGQLAIKKYYNIKRKAEKFFAGTLNEFK